MRFSIILYLMDVAGAMKFEMALELYQNVRNLRIKANNVHLQYPLVKFTGKVVLLEESSGILEEMKKEM